MYKYLLDKDKNLFYPLIDDKSIVNANTINDVQIEELFNPTVEDILVKEEYQFGVGPRASIEVECIPERAGKLAYLDVTTSNPDCCNVSYIDGSTIFLNTNRRGESTITITEANSGISKDVKVVVQAIPYLSVGAGTNGGRAEKWDIIKLSFEQITLRIVAYPYDGYQFDHWSDGNTENPREITIYEDTELRAFFEPIYYNIEVVSSNEEYGTVLGGGQFRYNSEIMISATPNSGYRFVLWSDGDTNPEKWIWVYEDVVYEAIFEELNPNLVIYYTSNDGLEIYPNAYGFGANLVDNTYTNGQGMMIFDSDVTIIGNSAFSSRSSLASIIIPNSVTNIEDYAFSSCSSLTSITIPNSVTSIGSYAFQDCFSLKSIVIPDSVTSIGSDPFLNCSSLTSPVYNAHCFVYMPASYSDTYIIPEGIEQIVAAAFYDCSSLTSVTIPNSVTNIGDNAFNNCSSLTSITIPNSVISIGNSVFDNCSSLTSVTIPNSVTSIGARAFASCHYLTSVTIGNGIVGILDYAFLDCRSLTTITCEAVTPPTLGSGNDLSSVTEVYVSAESVDAYKMATNWAYYVNKIQPIPS